MLPIIVPAWPAPSGVHAVATTRAGGVSAPPYDTLNLALHVGDEPAAVTENRRRVSAALKLPAQPRWLNQVHGATVSELGRESGVCDADASFTRRPGTVCVVMTADCLPLLICDGAGTQVAAVHAGWRGLAGGIIEETLKSFEGPREELLVWLGPAIGPDAFEVGDEVRETFVTADSSAADAFRANARGHWLADIYALARLRLARHGVTRVYGGEHCTVRESDTFFSYRRDGATGRMASMIWIDN